ncbi:VCBS repeat-containing protein [Bradyrhizobium sp. CNPSo 4010]|uniref:VCBS repeat-containing protein n=1 Tax=Bradyrhizobium agreste TaxID=2751811 RepID=A0ABS0PV41_9BRAD|nr:SpvB/TcaC N-terminal domain-containing protein [Bradyrhizobium agreste]MBH5400955.1 VCBS repeat-containing protein [Bradyrhizobium agreste]
MSAIVFAGGSVSGFAGTMSVPGSFDVSPTGAATYSMPISVPPGAAGMMPALSLAYSSQGGNGPLGMGWALAGLPSIGRCGRTLAQDGATGGVNFDANDRFCMNGQRLVATSGTYGGDGTQYRTEIESLAKIISHGSAGSGPAWFEVHTKSGQTMEFGNTADSRLLAQGQASVRVWGVNKVSDSKSNFYAVTYTSDLTNGQFYPSRIDYTGNVATGVGASNSVQFAYATRPDIIPQYQAGFRFTTAFRLTNVKTYVGSTLVSDYRLAYEQSGPANRSRLTKVSICDGSGSCLPSTSFNWTSTSSGFAGRQIWNSDPWGVSTGWTDNNKYPRWVMDVNGDGLPDLVGIAASAVVVSLNTGTSFGARQVWSTDAWGTSTGWTDNNTYPRMLVDVNGDGLPDLVGIAASAVVVSLNTGTSFGGRQTWSTDAWGVSTGWTDNNTYPRTLVDVNGDGLPDLVGIAASNVMVALNTGASFGPRQYWSSDPWGTSTGWTDNNTYPRWFTDVNGDGLPDLVGIAASAVMVSLNTGTGFGGRQTWSTDAWGVSTGWTDNNTYPRTLVDVNGDGLPDLVGIAASNVMVALNTGASFGPREYWSSDPWGTSTGWTDNNTYPRWFTDVNGDGLPDLVGIAASAVMVSLNTGTSFGGRQTWSTDAWGVSTGWTDNNTYPRMLVDVKGTGFQGIVGFAASDICVATNGTSGPAADVMTSAVNGLGSATTFTYQPGTNTSVVTKGTGTAFPMLDLVSSAYVVSQVNTSNGIGGTVGASYTYSGGRIDLRRRAFLGFAQTGVKDLQTGIASTTTYRQDFPYTGMIASTAKSVTPGTPPGGAAAQGMQLTQLSNSYQFSNASGAASVSSPSVNSAPYKVSLSQSVSSGSDLDGSALPSVTTTNQYDAYLNPTQVVTSTSDGFSKTTVSTYSNDTSAWYLGRLTRSSVTGVAP